MDSHSSSLGQYLRGEREKRGITIEQLASATKISVRLLHCLESDQYSELPAKPFVRGFVKSYARFLGVEPREVLVQFGEFIDGHAIDRTAREIAYSGYAFERREGDSSRRILTIILVSFAVIGVVVYLFVKGPLRSKHLNHFDELKAAKGFKPSPSPSVLAAAEPDKASSKPEADKAAESSGDKTHEKPKEDGSNAPHAVSAIVAPAPSPSPSLIVHVSAPTPVKSVAPEPSIKPEPSRSVVEATVKPSAVPSDPVADPSKNSSLAQALASRGPLLDKPDPLNSGANLGPKDIRHKVVLRAKTDLWVRFQVDDRPASMIIIREGRVLVLRAYELIRLQASAPEGATVSYNGGASQSLAQYKGTVDRGGDPTLVIPASYGSKPEVTFGGSRVLKGTKVPASRTPKTASGEGESSESSASSGAP